MKLPIRRLFLPSGLLLVAYSVLFSFPSAPEEPSIEVKPRAMTLWMDSTEWVSARVKVLNRGGRPCTVTAIKPSCSCGAATVLKNPVQPLDVAEIAVRINTSNMHDSVNTVEFLVESDAENSPYSFTTIVRRRAQHIDSVSKQH